METYAEIVNNLLKFQTELENNAHILSIHFARSEIVFSPEKSYIKLHIKFSLSVDRFILKKAKKFNLKVVSSFKSSKECCYYIIPK